MPKQMKMSTITVLIFVEYVVERPLSAIHLHVINNNAVLASDCHPVRKLRGFLLVY